MEVIILFLLLETTLISRPSATLQVFYVSPDNSTNTSCPFQPCATLSQYLLDNNGSLPVVSNVEYHFLSGEHHIPMIITLQYLHNFTITGSQRCTSVSAVIISNLQAYIKIFDSENVTIRNVIFKMHDLGIILDNILYNLFLNNCYSCKIMKVQFLEYGFKGQNLVGKSYLNDVLLNVTDALANNFAMIYLLYTSDFRAKFLYECTLIVNNIFMSFSDTQVYSAGIHVLLLPLEHVGGITIVIVNSYFHSINRTILRITSDKYATKTNIKIQNCTFRYNRFFDTFHVMPIMIDVELPQFNVTLSFINCGFFKNERMLLSTEVLKDLRQHLHQNPVCNLSSRVVIINCSFLNNSNEWTLLHFIGSGSLHCVNVYIIGTIFIFGNYIVGSASEILINFDHVVAHVSGPIYVSNNLVESVVSLQHSRVLFNGVISVTGNIVDTVMQFQESYVIFNGPLDVSGNVGSVMLTHSCNVTLNGPITISMNLDCEYIMLVQYSQILFSKNISFKSNLCHQIIVIRSRQEAAYIKVMEYSNITFSQNNYTNLIAVDINNDHYNFYPVCLFQYVASQIASVILPSHYAIIISDNVIYTCELSFYHFVSHCKWIDTAAFYGQNCRIINQQIIQLHQEFQHSRHHTTIFYCSNFAIDRLGTVYPGQKLQVELCMPCSGNYSILYAETHNKLLPESACKIAHQSEQVNVITNNSTVVSYTIVSEVNESCELFLTVSPFLYYIYEVFDVQLLPCPIGFTLQNGVCDCDPLLPTDIDTCYIDQSAIRRPANTWISHTQSGTSKYLISDCPMDYCLPFSSNVNLLHPVTQCQFNRTGILCSQCQHHLSMVFGSSRCMKCTNVHILITIIIIVAGIVLVLLLYLLNLTVTKATINGIILYADIISINYSVFLISNKTFKPLQLFISFTNLDLGFETCFYDGMNGYVKTWLHLFFPAFLIIIAFSIIIASRYSSRILRLTYRRSLPVLATLFLLSYTSVLRTVLTVLFSYSTITHVPSGHQKLVWSVDASVPLFGLKFTVLFITCLVLFLVLLFFNIILLFTRYLLWIKLINYFKPILDAFQGSYKDRYYYWVAIHIIMRSLFFALYPFQLKLRLVSGTVILVLFTSAFGYICPNKSKLINFQELLLLINLTIMHAVSYCGNESVFGIVINLMISLAFIQFCIIVIYHFLTYTCHCNIENALHSIKEKLSNYFTKDHHAVDIALLNIPDCTYNYSEYQGELVTDDFAANI